MVMAQARSWQDVEAAPVVAIRGFITDRTFTSIGMDDSGPIIEEDTNAILIVNANFVIIIDNTSLFCSEVFGDFGKMIWPEHAAPLSLNYPLTQRTCFKVKRTSTKDF
jgi:hypothetical protein